MIRVASLAAALALIVLLPASALAHPLGNFTINHYAGIRISPDRISLDVVIDRAEIPTFTERQRIDTDGDGQVSDSETEAERQVACTSLASSLSLDVTGRPLSLSVKAAGLSFPQGAGGLSTMRLVCEYAAPLEASLNAGTTVHLADRSSAGRLGWREIVAIGDGVTLTGAATQDRSLTRRLTVYPEELLSSPLAMTELTVAATAGGPTLPASCMRMPLRWWTRRHRQRPASVASLRRVWADSPRESRQAKPRDSRRVGRREARPTCPLSRGQSRAAWGTRYPACSRPTT